MVDVSQFDAEDARDGALAGLMSIGLIAGLAFVLGIEITPYQFAWLIGGFAVLAWFAQRSGDITVGFTIISIAMVFVIAQVAAPAWVTDAFSPISAAFTDITGFDLADLNALQMLVLSVTFVTLMIGIRLRVTGRAKYIGTIVDNISREYARYVRAWITIGRIVVLFMFSAVVVALEQAGIVVGELGNLMAEAPWFIASTIITLGGYLSMGGSLPYIGWVPLIGDLSPAGFLLLGLVGIGFAVAVTQEGSGPIAQFLRRRS